MRFFWNVILLPLKFVLLPFLIIGVILKILAGIGLGILGLLGGIFGLLFFVLLLPGAIIGLTLGGGIAVLATFAILAVVATAIPAIGGALINGVSNLLRRWA